MRKYFEIEGYFKDDKTPINGSIITNYDDVEEGIDDKIFFYGMEESEIISAIEEGENTALEFVITGYVDVTENFLK